MVYLVGAGTGDKNLITLKGKKCIEQADVIIYDHLINKELLNFSKKDCEYIYVGKQANQHTMKQEDINKLLVQKSERYVVRLKGGDPYVFGRGGEEADYLYQNNIEFEVIPGITSAIGGLCYAGIPITHREYASSFHVMTAHYKDNQTLKEKINWEAIAKLEGTLVFLMGSQHLKEITTHLIENGKPKDTPIALISQATLPEQKTVVGTLETIDRDTKIEPPMLIVIGDVVQLHNHLNFYEKKPLFGKQVVVTRSKEQSSELIDKIEALGGKVIALPMLEIKKEDTTLLSQALKNLKAYTYLVLTSANAVHLFFDTLKENQCDIRQLAHLKIAVIGKSTSKALETYGIFADIIPPKANSEALAEELLKHLTPSDKVLLPQSLLSRSTLKEKLSVVCSVDAIPFYQPVMPDDIENKKEHFIEQLKANKIDFITFTSSSTVMNFVDYIGRDNLKLLKNTKLISIGPMTTKTLKGFKLSVYKEVNQPNINSLIEEVKIKKGEEISW